MQPTFSEKSNDTHYYRVRWFSRISFAHEGDEYPQESWPLASSNTGHFWCSAESDDYYAYAAFVRARSEQEAICIVRAGDSHLISISLIESADAQWPNGVYTPEGESFI